MSLWDVFGRSMRWTYKEPDLTGQGILGTWAANASQLQGTGRLVLTDQALLFCPADLTQTKKLVETLFSVAGVPGGDVLASAAGLARDSVLAIPNANIASAQRAGGPSLFKAPTLRIDTKVGSVHEFGVMFGVGYPNISKKNDEALSDLLAKLQPLLTP